MTALYLTEDDVAQLVDMPTAVDAVEEGFRQLASGGAENVPRHRARAKGIVLHGMHAAAGYLGLIGYKMYTTTRSGARFQVGLHDTEGRPVAMIEANRLGQLRTGAATGVAVKHLTDESLDELGLIGCGYQAETQLEAAATVRRIRRAVVYGRDAGRREAFAKRMGERLQIEVIAAESAEDAVRGKLLVITATSSRTPVVAGEWIADGALVCAVGSNDLRKAELDVAAVRWAGGCVVCDSVDACRLEAGDLVEAVDSGLFEWENAIELGDIVVGKVKIGERDAAMGGGRGIRIFKSVGLAIEDIALAGEVLSRARSQNVGTPLPY